MAVSYKECLKNHAASIGGHAIDGCREFMSSSSSFNSNDPTSLKCAACGCHRNFHRRRILDSNPNTLHRIYPLPQAAPPPQPPSLSGPGLSPSSSTSRSASPSNSIQTPNYSSPSPLHVSQFSAPSYYASAPHMLLSLGNGYATVPSEHQHRDMGASFNSTDVKTENPSGRKRSRTKFSTEQKEKMYLFCEKLGWKMQGVEERLLQELCNEIGVSRGVFKVWMHNNKRKSSATNLVLSTDRAFAANEVDGTVGFSRNIDAYNFDGGNDDTQIKEDSSTDLHLSADESD